MSELAGCPSRLDVQSAGCPVGWMSSWLDVQSAGCLSRLDVRRLDVFRLDVRVGWTSSRLDVQSAGCPFGWISSRLDVRRLDVFRLDVSRLDVRKGRVGGRFNPLHAADMRTMPRGDFYSFSMEG